MRGQEDLPFQYIPFEITGRESFQPREKELDSIRSTLIPQDQTPIDTETPGHRSFLITGPEGIGKTELALRFIEQYRDQFDAVFFLDADSENRLSSMWVYMSITAINLLIVRSSMLIPRLETSILIGPSRELPRTS